VRPGPDPAADLWRRTSGALDALLDLPAAGRAAALERLAAEDPEVHREVVALLAADPGSGGFLSGAVGRAAAALAGEEPPVEGAPGGPSAVIGGWRLLRLLGRGGMGEVFLAERTGGDFEQLGALKLVRRGLDTEEVLARFRRERQILARLTHPGIARLLDGGVAPDGRPFFVLEMVDGEPITRYAAARGLELRALLRLFLRVLDAVEAAHRSFVVHRDLKPSNLFVTPQGDVKLLDFGIAKLLGEDGDGEATRSGARPLTPAYAAPEQILAGEVSTATDAYALGVVLYELLSGERPLPRVARTPVELAREVSEEAPPLPSEAVRRRARGAARPEERARLRRRARELTGDLDAILLRVLAADPRRRYPTVAAFAGELKAYLDGHPVAARGAARGYRLRKVFRRHRLAFGAAALVLVSLAGGLVAALWQARRAERAARRAERTEEFLIGLFEAVDPGRTRGESVTARQLLDQGARQLDRELGAEPEVRAALADTLARTYLGLGSLDEAGLWADRSLAAPRASASEGEAALAALTRAEVSLAQGDLARARRQLESLVPRIAALFGEESREALRARAGLATVLEIAGEFPAALALWRELVGRAEVLYGHDSPRTAALLAGVGGAAGMMSRFAEAETALRDALGRYERSGAADDPMALETRATLADLLESMGRSHEALAMLSDVVARQRRVLGPSHPLLADGLLKQGFALLNMRRTREARAPLAEAAAILEPLGHFEAASAWRYLGQVDLMEERYAAAFERFVRAEAWYRERTGDDSPLTWAAVVSRALAEAKLGRLAEAEAAQRAAIAALARLHGPESNEVRGPKKHLGETLRAAGRVEEALALHREVLALERRLFGPGEDRAVTASYVQLALDHEARGTPPALAEARRLLDRALAALRRRGDDPVRTGEALAVSGRVAAAQGDPARARRELSEADRLLAAVLAPAAPTRRRLREELGKLRRPPAHAMVPRWGDRHAAADHRAGRSLPELGAPGGGGAAGAAAAALRDPLLAGPRLGVRLGGALPPGERAGGGSAGPAPLLPAVQLPPLRPRRRRGPLGALPADAPAGLDGAGRAPGVAAAGLARAPPLPAPVAAARRGALALVGA
jgi:serine/threonine-protein kinase